VLPLLIISLKQCCSNHSDTGSSQWDKVPSPCPHLPLHPRCWSGNIAARTRPSNWPPHAANLASCSSSGIS